MPKPVADPLAILKKRRFPAIAILDTGLAILHTNREAATLLATFGGEQNPLTEELTRLAGKLARRRRGGSEDEVSVHIAGEAVYGLRATWLSGTARSSGASRLILVHIDTVALEREIDFDAVRRRYHISRREQDVLRMLYYGKSNKEIAGTLFISEYTVKDHIKAIMAKMGASSRSEVVYKLTTAS